MRIATLNLNGLRAANRHGFRPWFQQAELDVICLQEVRMQKSQQNADHRPPIGWKFIQSDAEKKGYSGVALWSHRDPIEMNCGIGLKWADSEGRAVKMVFDDIIIYSIYFPSGSSGEVRQAKKDEFLAYILEKSPELLAEHEHVLICGDVNIAHTEMDIHNPKSNQKTSGFLPHERQWFSDFLQAGWVDVYRALYPEKQDYSWWSQRGRARVNNKGWRIDYHLSSPALAERAQTGFILPYTEKLSDHAPMIIDYDL